MSSVMFYDGTLYCSLVVVAVVDVVVIVVVVVVDNF